MGHILDHVPQAAVLGDAASQQDLLLADVGHGALCDLGEHREGGLLNGVADVLQRYALPLQGEGGIYHAGEGDVHALDRVRELVVLRPPAGEPLDLRTGIEPHAQIPPELVEHVPDADVLRLTEDPVAALGEGYHLRVAARCVQKSGVPAPCEGAAYLDVRDAVVHAYDRDAHHAGERPCGGGGDPEAGAETRTHGERYQIDILRSDARLVKRLLHLDGGDLRMVVGGLAGMEAPLGRTEHVQLIRQNVAFRIDDADPQRMGRPLNSHR